MSQQAMQLPPAREPINLPAWLFFMAKFSQHMLNSRLTGAVAANKTGKMVRSSLHSFRAERKGIIVELRVGFGGRSYFVMSFHYLRWPIIPHEQTAFLRALFSFVFDDIHEVDFEAARRAVRAPARLRGDRQ